MKIVPKYCKISSNEAYEIIQTKKPDFEPDQYFE